MMGRSISSPTVGNLLGHGDISHKRIHKKSHPIPKHLTGNNIRDGEDVVIKLSNGGDLINCVNRRIQVQPSGRKREPSDTEQEFSSWRTEQDGNIHRFYCKYSVPRLYWVPNQKGRLKLMEKSAADELGQRKRSRIDYRDFTIIVDTKKGGKLIQHVATEKSIRLEGHRRRLVIDVNDDSNSNNASNHKNYAENFIVDPENSGNN